MSLSIHSPDELIAALPHLLGFKPEESLIFVPMRPDLPLVRVDLPTTARAREGVWGAVCDAFRRHAQPGAGTAIVCVTHDRHYSKQLSQEFTARLSNIGIDAPLRLWADDSHWCDLVTGQSGLQSDDTRNRIAAATVLNGQPRPATSRSSLAASLVGDREPITRLLAHARAAIKTSTPRAETAWAQARAQLFHRNGVRLNDNDAARLLVGIESIAARDCLWEGITRSTAPSHVALWRDMTRRAPDEVRTAPAALLGFASWLDGDGAMAWCALDQIPGGKPYALADLVEAAVQGGVHPREWEEATRRAAVFGTDRSSDFTNRRTVAGHDSISPTHGI
ncbi:DUF4192 domain-containing protein [Aeromicrobium piscarium]|uniref:DUF4192 domain-containing protein n=1 Tax=Aeromicrobium piscarium TaxID=2590901 RepID=A0A554SH76_9ACTN|nr:DUF4192 domain-containing protein [Aeromicrobium piscarium]TSD65691.1 DUF4192 domain-containing protein [Aeromicrobium piscarium]